MRVISGKYKRKKLVAPEGHLITRPTSDRIKESIFNILSGDLENSNVIDLFSGTGGLGIEALSRGANFVVFVENNIQAIQALRTNLKNLGEVNSVPTHIVEKNVSLFLAKGLKMIPGRTDEQFSIIFADPPYSSLWYNNAIDEIENSKICSDNCLLVVEMSSDRNDLFIPEKFQKVWEKLDERIYGKTKVQFWRRNND